MKTCCIPECDRHAHARGMCGTHYNRWRTTGDAVKRRARRPTCHPERPHYAKGLCSSCYLRHRRLTDPMPSQLVENRAPYDPAKRRSAKLRQHGLTPEMFDAMLSYQNGVCAICGAASSGRWGTLAVDHDHETGRVRGLLCSRCNTAIGLFGDDPARMNEAAAYLRAHLPQADEHRRRTAR